MADPKPKKIESIDDLQYDDLNANKGTDEGRALVKSSLERLKAGRSILVDAAGNVIAGNKTLEQARELGMEVMVIPTAGDKIIVHQRTDLNIADQEARELGILDNRTSQIGLAWDEEAFRELNESYDLDLHELGFNDDEINGLLGTFSPSNIEDQGKLDEREKIQCPECGHKFET